MSLNETGSVASTQTGASSSLNTTRRPEFTAKFQILRLEPDKYANENGIHTHVSIATAWTFGSNMVYTAVPPGVDVSDRCVARMAREVLTGNPEDCEYVIRLFDVNDLDWGWYGNYVDVQCADDSISRLLDLSEEFERNNEPAQCAWDELRLGTTFRYPRTVLQTTEISVATTTIAQVTSDASGRLTTMLQTSTMPLSKVTLTFGPVPAPAPISTAPPAAIVTTRSY